MWKEGFGLLISGNSSVDLASTVCCAGRSPLMDKAVTVSVMGLPPYVIFNPVTKALGGIDLQLFQV